MNPLADYLIEREIFTCDADSNTTGTDDNSYQTSAIVADPEWVYAIEWNGDNGRVVRINWSKIDYHLSVTYPQGYTQTDTKDDVGQIWYPRVPQGVDYRLVAGQYDWTNKRVVMGGIDEPTVCYWNVGDSPWVPDMHSSITCNQDIQGVPAGGTIGTDGTYLYSKRYSDQFGSDRVGRLAAGTHGLSFGTWQGWASNSYMSPGVSSFYHVDGYYYVAATNCAYNLQRTRVTGSQPPGVCDNIDQNCNGIIDEICDMDNDDFCDRYMENTGVSSTCSGGMIDCDDCDPSIHCTWYYPDLDQDGYGDASAPTCECVLPSGHVEDGSDCDDTDPLTYPGAAEDCADGLDTDCDEAGSRCIGRERTRKVRNET
mgnify:CR=1 FL=1